MSKPRTVAIALNRPIGDSYTYELPPELEKEVEIGALVEVPLGPKKEIGAVVELDPMTHEEATARFRLRKVIRRVSADYVIPREVMGLARWIADYYFCNYGEALAAVSMVGFGDVRFREQTVYRLNLAADEEGLTSRQAEAPST